MRVSVCVCVPEKKIVSCTTLVSVMDRIPARLLDYGNYFYIMSYKKHFRIVPAPRLSYYTPSSICVCVCMSHRFDCLLHFLRMTPVHRATPVYKIMFILLGSFECKMFPFNRNFLPVYRQTNTGITMVQGRCARQQ